jgi:hypothetical protein
MNGLPLCRPHQLQACPAPRRWLIEGLWASQGVGIVGGEPKSYKSWLALDLAVSVASGAPCLRRFPPRQNGPVVFFPAEDPLHVVRARLEAITQAAEVAFETLDLHVITAPTLRLDVNDDRVRLRNTVADVRPKLLVLDPFVRLHRTDENAAAEVAPLLGFLRTLQRRYGTAVVMVHHARKGAAHARAGQALRGSSELHAWGDSNLYLRRQRDTLRLHIEHRAAPSADDLALELHIDGAALALRVVDPSDEDPCSAKQEPSPTQRVEQVLTTSPTPLTRRELRQLCRMRSSRLGDALETLLTQGRILRSDLGYQLADE